MDKNQVLQSIREVGLIPILRTPSADDALALAEVLHDAQLTNVEIPLTVPGAVEVIAEIVSRYGADMLVGAGTVLDQKQAAACVAAGAQFIISPGLDLDTVGYCQEAGVACFPGALTPTEIITAWKAGADMIKVFPCGAMGGASYIKFLKAPLPMIELCPTGGVSVQTAAAFIRAGASAMGVGADLVDLQALRDGRPELIGERARLYLEIVREARQSPQ